ncbi:MAG TPA: calcium-binding protein [Tepidisphaeraceae bacterium]|jgi:Ca2+-binding RTX toxin-like protein|nr:calcium-binding protein [Tepidisphaeraceae bacterium]
MRKNTGTEPLEPRRLLSASFASLNPHGTLSIIGTSKNDVITVSLLNGQIIAKLNAASLSFPKSSVQRIWADGFAGNDQITNKTALPSSLIGSSGNDTLTGGTSSDLLQPGPGANTLNSNGGHDTIDYSDEPAMNFEISNSPDDISNDLGGLSINFDVVLNYHGDLIQGTLGNDTFQGAIDGPLDITIAGGNGNDTFGFFNDNFDTEDPQFTLDGGNGDDAFGTSDETAIPASIIGGNGNDFLEDDVFFVDEPDDIDMGAGHDSIEENQSPLEPITCYLGPGVEDLDLGEDGTYTIFGNNLNNKIDCASSGGTTIYGEGGNDIINCVDNAVSEDPIPSNVIHGGDGNDTISALAVNEAPAVTSVFGDAGNDTLIADIGKRLLDGGPGNDSLVPPTVFDSDFFYSSRLQTTLIGGAGNDTADFSADTFGLHITLDNLTNDGIAGARVMNVHSDIETILGGAGDDYIQGSASPNKILGNAGNDTLLGGDGNDTLFGNSGRDRLYGQAGNDILFAKDNRSDILDGGPGSDSAQRDPSLDQLLNIETFL